MKYFLLVFVSIVFFSCKNAVQLENESIESGKVDTVMSLYYMGMSRYKVDEINSRKSLSDPNFKTRQGKAFRIIRIGQHTVDIVRSFEYNTNDSLIRVVDEVANNEPIASSELKQSCIDKYGQPLKISTYPFAKCSWLKGNIRVDFVDTMNRLLVLYSDINGERREDQLERDKKARYDAYQQELQSSPYYQVAVNQIDEYNIAARQGDLMQVYTQASLVAAAFLQAKDEHDYDKWKHIEDSLARRIGLPVYR